MADFNDFLNALKSELTNIAADAADDIKDELISDGTAFVKKTKEDLVRWMNLLAEGKLTKDELEYLLQAKKDLAEMEALKQKGLAEARIDKLKSAIISSIVGSTLSVLR